MSEILDRIIARVTRRNCRFVIGDVEYVMNTTEASTIRNRISKAISDALDEELDQPNSVATVRSKMEAELGNEWVSR